MCTDLPFAFPIRVPDNLLVEFGKFTGLHWNDTFSMEPFVCEALRNYMNPAPAAQAPAVAQSESGYQWKEVFLPEGTRLRASFDHKQYFAVVAGTEIEYGDHAISPSCFANLFGCGNRNAWKAVWLRLPGSTEWLLADICRSARKAAIARLMAGDTDGGAQPSPPKPPAPSAPAAPPTWPAPSSPSTTLARPALAASSARALPAGPTASLAPPASPAPRGNGKQPAKQPTPRRTGERGTTDSAFAGTRARRAPDDAAAANTTRQNSHKDAFFKIAQII
ncbi:hypothetical protein [Duganella aceris]|uniref:hypothetical protein n=1 Tax=Duganella aceris TaxID=2703883 RepID=UPI001E38BEE0|nr:hypothetical protein [Duganella aceris]